MCRTLETSIFSYRVSIKCLGRLRNSQFPGGNPASEMTTIAAIEPGHFPSDYISCSIHIFLQTYRKAIPEMFPPSPYRIVYRKFRASSDSSKQIQQYVNERFWWNVLKQHFLLPCGSTVLYAVHSVLYSVRTVCSVLYCLLNPTSTSATIKIKNKRSEATNDWLLAPLNPYNVPVSNTV